MNINDITRGGFRFAWELAVWELAQIESQNPETPEAKLSVKLAKEQKELIKSYIQKLDDLEEK